MCARSRQPSTTVIAVVVALTLAETARADELTFTSPYSISNGTTFTSLTPPNGGWAGSPPNLFAVGEGVHVSTSLPQFDPALGTLSSVTFTLTATQQPGAGELWVAAGGPSTFLRAVVDEVRAVGPTGRLVTAGSSIQVNDFNPGPGFYQLSIQTSSPTASAAYTDPGTLAAYPGTGTFSVDVFKHLELGASPGNYFQTRLTSPGLADGTLAVTYEFTPVPETPGWVVLGTGLLCALLWRAARTVGRGHVALAPATG
jgi:hypothetical protein